MSRLVLRAILVVGVLMLGATEASAKKFRFFHVGGGGHSEEIVKVLDLPDIPQLRRTDGRHIDLGYKFTSGGGEWVGYVGDDGKYLALSEDAVQSAAGGGRRRQIAPRSRAAGFDRRRRRPHDDPDAARLRRHPLSCLFFLRGRGASGRRLLLRGEAEAAGKVPNPYQAVSDPMPPSSTRPVSFAKPAAAMAGAARSRSFGASSIPARGFGRRT